MCEILGIYNRIAREFDPTNNFEYGSSNYDLNM